VHARGHHARCGRGGAGQATDTGVRWGSGWPESHCGGEGRWGGVRSTTQPENGGVRWATAAPGRWARAVPVGHETGEGRDGRGVWAAVGRLV
jgi:hypothetical protein